MAAISKFSTSQNFQRLSAAKAELVEAIKESQMAVQAGIPNAQSALTTAQEGLKRIEQVLSVYFPTGSPPDSES